MGARLFLWVPKTSSARISMRGLADWAVGVAVPRGIDFRVDGVRGVGAENLIQGFG